MVLCLIQAIWGASTSVSDEVEGRTALTVLSKPIRRHSFVLGKFVGIAWTVGLMFVVLGTVFLVVVAYKPLYDAREASKVDTTWQLCHYEMVMTVPGLLLSFMETLVLAAISVAISTRLPLFANFVICFTIYVLGNITPTLVEAASQQFEIVAFFAQLIATVLPNLEAFNIQAAIAADAEVPLIYLGVSLLYCVMYVAIALLLALFLFEDRDLA
jgi:ABC-type transport system involved in multi-copper enzyme maturation permease subunit